MTTRPRLVLLDSASLYFRAFYGVKEPLVSADGTPVNALRGFMDMTASIIASRRPARLVACWDDDWRPEFRVAAIPSYKTHRVAAAPAEASVGAVADAAAVDAQTTAEDVPDELNVQVPLIEEVLAALGISKLGMVGCEADDVIGTLATREVQAASGAGQVADVDVVTGDRDLFQLVDDAAAVRVLYTARGVRNAHVVDQAYLSDHYGVSSGAMYADMATLRGDPSDGLPGVPGIGEKTAATLLRSHGNLAAIVAAAATGGPTLSATQAAKILAAQDYLAVAPGVVQVLRDAELPQLDDRLSPVELTGELVDLGKQLGISGALQRLCGAINGAARAGA